MDGPASLKARMKIPDDLINTYECAKMQLNVLPATAEYEAGHLRLIISLIERIARPDEPVNACAHINVVEGPARERLSNGKTLPDLPSDMMWCLDCGAEYPKHDERWDYDSPDVDPRDL